MIEIRPPTGSGDFFTSSAARQAGLTDDFWRDVYALYLEDVNRDPVRSFDQFHIARTVRVRFRERYFDVLVRSQPEPREELILRFTAFPADAGQQVRQVSRSYRRHEVRSVIGEAALMDTGGRGNLEWAGLLGAEGPRSEFPIYGTGRTGTDTQTLKRASVSRSHVEPTRRPETETDPR